MLQHCTRILSATDLLCPAHYQTQAFPRCPPPNQKESIFLVIHFPAFVLLHCGCVRSMISVNHLTAKFCVPMCRSRSVEVGALPFSCAAQTSSFISCVQSLICFSSVEWASSLARLLRTKQHHLKRVGMTESRECALTQGLSEFWV